LNWTASWIWAEGRQSARAERAASCVLFRRSFSLRHAPRLASAFCTASRRYQLAVNGRFLGRGPAPGGPRLQPYDAYDLAPFLTRGENVVAAVCIHGGCDPTPAGFLFQATIACGEEPPLVLVSDAVWRAYDATGWRAAPQGSRPDAWGEETCHPEREPHGWEHAGFADAGWLRAQRLGPAGTPPWERLVPRGLPPLREVERRPARTVHEDAEGVCYDFGAIVAGYPRFRLPDEASASIEIAYGDWVDPEGRLSARPDAPLRCDRIVLEEARSPSRRTRRPEETIWQPLGRRAFRYCRVSPPVPAGGELTTVTEGYPVEDRGAFRCSDPVLNDAWTLGRETLHATMQEQFEVCPARARHETVEATRAAALAGYYAFGDYRLAGRALWRWATEGGDGSAAGPYGPHPSPEDTRSQPGADTFRWVLMLSEYLRHAGDDRLTRQLFPHAAVCLASAFAATNARTLLEGSPSIGATPLNALFCAALRAAAWMARQVNENAGEFEHRARSVQQAVNYSLWSESERAFADSRDEETLSSCSPETNWLALALEVVDAPRQGVLLRRLLADRGEVLRLPSAFLQSVAEALYHRGYVEDALDLIRSVWGEMRRRGATSCWERLNWSAPGAGGEPIGRPPPGVGVPTSPRPIDRDAPPTGSLCHAGATWPTWFLPARILGVSPKGAGWSELVVRPVPADLGWAEGIIPTLSGDARVGWRRDPGEFELSVHLPDGLRADLLMPWREGQVAMWGDSVVWPAPKAEPGLELDHPIERVPEGLLVRVIGPKQVTLTTRH
jgi:hypothetical protein